MAKFLQTVTINCPACGSKRVVKGGTRGDYQRYQCQSCRKKFTPNGKALGMQNPAEQIGAAIDMYYSGHVV